MPDPRMSRTEGANRNHPRAYRPPEIIRSFFVGTKEGLGSVLDAHRQGYPGHPRPKGFARHFFRSRSERTTITRRISKGSFGRLQGAQLDRKFATAGWTGKWRYRQLNDVLGPDVGGPPPVAASGRTYRGGLVSRRQRLSAPPLGRCALGEIAFCPDHLHQATTANWNEWMSLVQIFARERKRPLRKIRVEGGLSERSQSNKESQQGPTIRISDLSAEPWTAQRFSLIFQERNAGR